MSPRQKRQTVEDLFDLSEDYLHKPVPERLRPGLIRGVDRKSGQDCLVKVWLKPGGGGDAEFRELWRHERLQVDRVMNYPDADEVMVGISDMFETDDAFGAVYEAGFTPLAAQLKTAPARHWLKSLDIIPSRVILWGNLGRLARAIGIIHTQGLIHGRIDTFAVFTEGDAAPDFRLGGFEWSVGIGDVQPLDPSMHALRARVDRLIYSYADDWRALGALFAELLGLDPEKLRDDDPFRSGVKTIDISDSEIDFLRRRPSVSLRTPTPARCAKRSC